MNFGTYLKEQRTKLALTQPDAAAKIGIEQSYLSKLETGKSIPSNEIFNKIKEVYKIDVNDMTQTVLPNDLIKLNEVKSVKDSIYAHEKKQVTSTRSWLVAGFLSLVIGGSCLGAAFVPVENAKEYIYRSEAVLLPGEELRTFSPRNISLQSGSDLSIEERQKLIKRIDQKYKTFSSPRGSSFVEDDNEGRRFYESVTWTEVKGSQLRKWLMIPALAFLIGGLACFYISRKWRKPTNFA